MPPWEPSENVLPACQCIQTIGAGGRLVSKMESAASCGQFSQGVPEIQVKPQLQRRKICGGPMSTS